MHPTQSNYRINFQEEEEEGGVRYDDWPGMRERNVRFAASICLLLSRSLTLISLKACEAVAKVRWRHRMIC